MENCFQEKCDLFKDEITKLKDEIEIAISSQIELERINNNIEEVNTKSRKQLQQSHYRTILIPKPKTQIEELAKDFLLPVRRKSSGELGPQTLHEDFTKFRRQSTEFMVQLGSITNAAYSCKYC